MSLIWRRRPSPAMVVACLALAVALGGTSYAAVRLPANSVGTKQLKKNAVTSAKVKNDTLTGADVNEARLGQVPSATSATNATSAANAGHASNADSATTAGTANAAFSTYHDAAMALPDTLAVFAILNVPTAGNFVVNAKTWVYNISTTGSTASECQLRVGAATIDRTVFDVDEPQADDQEVVTLQGVYSFAAAGQLVLLCTDYGQGDDWAYYTRITAVQVAQLTNTPY
jgi:hypothetical protein